MILCLQTIYGGGGLTSSQVGNKSKNEIDLYCRSLLRVRTLILSNLATCVAAHRLSVEEPVCWTECMLTFLITLPFLEEHREWAVVSAKQTLLEMCFRLAPRLHLGKSRQRTKLSIA